MRNRGALLVLLALAAVLWAGLVALVNRSPPTPLNRVFFLAIWLGAVTFSVIPVSYLANWRWARPLGRTGDLSRSIRQGVLVGALATIITGLQFMRVLTLLNGALLVLVVVMVEVLT